MSNLVLGTAQLGMHYGIANKSGKPDADAAREIICTAWDGGIREFDTAQAYGESERILGEVIRSLKMGDDIKIITKLNPGIDYMNRTEVERAVAESICRLGVSRLYGLMLHREACLDLLDKGLMKNLQGIIASGMTLRIGISVYSPEKALVGLKTEGIDFVQLPSNILDRRFEKAGVFGLAEKLHKDIYVRSVFLQGLIFLKSNELPNHLHFAESVIRKLEVFLAKNDYLIKPLSLGYVKQAFPKAKVLIGIETPEQVEENIQIWSGDQPEDVVTRVRCAFPDVDERILNPSLWKQE